MLPNLLQPKLRYLGDRSPLLSIDVLREAYMLDAVNLKRAKVTQPNKRTNEIPKFKVGDLVLLGNHKKQTKDAEYTYNFRICKITNERLHDL